MALLWVINITLGVFCSLYGINVENNQNIPVLTETRVLLFLIEYQAKTLIWTDSLERVKAVKDVPITYTQLPYVDIMQN